MLFGRVHGNRTGKDRGNFEVFSFLRRFALRWTVTMLTKIFEGKLQSRKHVWGFLLKTRAWVPAEWHGVRDVWRVLQRVDVHVKGVSTKIGCSITIHSWCDVCKKKRIKEQKDCFFWGRFAFIREEDIIGKWEPTHNAIDSVVATENASNPSWVKHRRTQRCGVSTRSFSLPPSVGQLRHKPLMSLNTHGVNMIAQSFWQVCKFSPCLCAHALCKFQRCIVTCVTVNQFDPGQKDKP